MSLINDPSGFGMMTSFEGQKAVLALRGRVEGLAAFDLWAALAGTIDLQREEVVLDLSELDFIGAAGLVALANAERSFADAGVELTIRAAAPLLRRFLGAMELNEVDRLDHALARLGLLDREQVGEPNHHLSQALTQDSTADLRQVSAISTNSDVVDGALRLVVELAQSSVSGADGVSVSLRRHGELLTVAATDETVMEMDRGQYATGEGPCVDATLQGRWFHAASLDTETRWPSFIPLARALGIRAILSSPLTAFEESVGALNIYSRTPLTFGVEAQEMAAGFARKASVLLGDARVGLTDAQLAVRFQEALRSRDIISTAKGIVMERESLNEDDAFTNLLRQSIKSGVSLLNRAQGFALSGGQTDRASERQDDA
jgi:anti-anti-sigma regulatory factor